MTELSQTLLPVGSWIPLSNRAVFELTGPDRVRFLNGQVSNDVSKDLEQEAIAACLCTLKGKVEALLWISSDGERLIIDGELSQREQLFARLDRYLIADDCELKDITEEARLIHHFDESLPGVVSKRTALAGRDYWTSTAEPEGFDDAKELSIEAFEKAELLAKIPKAGFEITANEFPAELGIDQWAVDFHKGCYLGQEVISRIESVGKVKRFLMLVSMTDSCEREQAVSYHEASGVTTRPGISVSEEDYLSLAFIRNLNPGADPQEPLKVSLP